MLKIISEWTEKRADGRGTRAFCMAECECGATSRFDKSNVTRGNSTRCKECARESRSESHKTHGASLAKNTDKQTRKAYVTWRGIKARCLNGNDKRFSDYGGRGITICNRWLDSFEAFFADMGPPPTLAHSIDRIDNNQGYSKDNCKWSTPTEQGRNKRNNHLLTVSGATKAISAWSEESGTMAATIIRRVSAGWSDEHAVFGRPGKYSVDGELYQSIAEIAEKFSMSLSGAHARIGSEKWPEWVKL